MDYSEYLPYLEDSIDSLLDKFQSDLLSKTSKTRCLQIREELRIYLTHFKSIKDNNPDKVIDDHVGAILLSYMINPDLDIHDRDAHYNGCWYSLWGDIDKKSIKEVKEICAIKNPNDQRWTEVCLKAVDEYHMAMKKPRLLDLFKRKK